MSEVKLPIETIREGNKITKICVEDVYKMINRILEPLNKATDYLDRFNTRVGDYEGHLITGVGNSKPCLTDAFDEEIGNNIAFMKAKLKINLKKLDFLYKEQEKVRDILDVLYQEADKVSDYIDLDVQGIRKHNPNFDIAL